MRDPVSGLQGRFIGKRAMDVSCFRLCHVLTVSKKYKILALERVFLCFLIVLLLGCFNFSCLGPLCTHRVLKCCRELLEVKKKTLDLAKTSAILGL